MPQPLDDENEELQLTEDQQIEKGPDDETGDDDQAGGADAGGGEDGARDGDGDTNVNDEDDEITVVSFGDESAELDQEGDSSTIRQLRKELREAKQRIRETEKAPVVQKRELRPKPTSEDHAFDDEAYAADLEKWFAEKAEVERETAQANEQQQQIQREWEKDVARFETQKAALKVEDLADAEEAVSGSLNLAQQAVIVKAAENPAVLMYALGKSPAKLAELAKITDVIKLAAAVAKMEGTVKVQKRRKGPALDAPQRGSAVIQSSDKREAELEKEAERTGDRTALARYRKQLKERGKK